MIASVTGCSTCNRVFISMNHAAAGPQPLRAVGNELDGAGADIADRLRGLDGGLAHRGAQLGAHARRRRFLDHLLVAALQRTVALVEMDGIAVGVGKHLQLDMPRRRNIFLDQHAGVAERTFGLALRALQRRVEIDVPIDAPHALAAAAGDRLDQHRIADLVGLLFEEGRLLTLAVIARHDRHAGLLHQRLGAVLQPHGADRRGRRPDEHDARLGAGLREFGVLGEKSVARMDALRAGLARHLDQPVDDEIALGRGRRTDRIGLVALPDMERLGIGLRIDRDGAKPKPRRGARDPARDLTAVGDQD